MYDSIEVDTVPANPQAVAGYVGGNWPTFNPLKLKFPNAKHLSIAVNAQEDAECLDIENGDAVPAQAPAWVKRQMSRGIKNPVVYASVSEMPAVLAALNLAGIKRSQVRLWTAHYTTQHICNPFCGFGFRETADGTQYTSRALNRNLDESELQDSFFGPPPPPPDPYHYDWFSTGPFSSKWGDLDERKIVLSYDGARKHPVRYFLYLKSLRAKLFFLANRVYTVAHEQPVSGHPSWELYYRGWRYQQLIHRSQGLQIAH